MWSCPKWSHKAASTVFHVRNTFFHFYNIKDLRKRRYFMFTLNEALVICGFVIRGFDSFDSHPILQETKLLFMYRVCHRLRLIKWTDYFWVIFGHFLPLLKWASFFEAAAKPGLSLKPNQTKFNQVKLFQIPDKVCSNFRLAI